MIIGGLQKFSMLDYPGHLSAIIFTQGCNFNCQFCYNPMLVAWSITGKFKRKGHSPIIKKDDLFVFLKSRIGKLEAVVITGGEPTIQPDLPDFIAKIKNLGYSVKLDTNGSNPEMIKNLIDKKLIDYIAMDIKAPKEKLEQIVGLPARLYPNIVKSVKIIMESGLPPSNWAGKYEFRTTLVPGLLDKNDIIKIAKTIKGARVWYLQRFKSNVGLLNKKLQGIKPFTEAEMKEMRKAAEKYVKICEIR
ncbi:anaerobic ribonucleoside-triphosphate reductase activating protein [Candidatus Parcubacteria bacterium]|nr:anaerobic ribonucleoside-triphosphate reductase activating protein [Candidatus Parcubacteria bacterium]